MDSPSTSGTDQSNTDQSKDGAAADGSPREKKMEKRASDFKFFGTLGEGSFSTVYLAREVESDREWAIKVCNKALIRKEKKVEYVMREKECLIQLSHRPHPFFISLYCTFHDDTRLCKRTLACLLQTVGSILPTRELA